MPRMLINVLNKEQCLTSNFYISSQSGKSLENGLILSDRDRQQ